MTRDRIRQPDIEKDFMMGVKQVRLDKGLKQVDMCRLCGIPQNMMTHLETGRTRVNLDRAVEFQKALDTNIFDLIQIGQQHRERMILLSKGVIA